MQDREVRALLHLVDEGGEGAAGEPGQGLLPGVAAADLERGHAEPEAALVLEVGHEVLVGHRAQQVVRRGARAARSAAAIRSSGTGPDWVARNRSTRRVRVAAGTWLTPPR